MDADSGIKAILERLSRLETSESALKEENRLLRTRLENLEARPAHGRSHTPHEHKGSGVRRVSSSLKPMESPLHGAGASTRSSSSILSATSRPHKADTSADTPTHACGSPHHGSPRHRDGEDGRVPLLAADRSESGRPVAMSALPKLSAGAPPRPRMEEKEAFLSPSEHALPLLATPPTMLPTVPYMRAFPTRAGGDEDGLAAVAAAAATAAVVTTDTSQSPPEFALVGFGSRAEAGASESVASTDRPEGPGRGHTPRFHAAKSGNSPLNRLDTHASDKEEDDDEPALAVRGTEEARSSASPRRPSPMWPSAVPSSRCAPPGVPLSPFSRSLSTQEAPLPSSNADDPDAPSSSLPSSSTTRKRMSISAGMTVESVSRTLIQEMAKIMMDMQRLDKDGKETAKRLRQETQSRRATAKKLVYKLAEVTDAVWNVYDRLTLLEEAVLGPDHARDDGTGTVTGEESESREETEARHASTTAAGDAHRAQPSRFEASAAEDSTDGSAPLPAPFSPHDHRHPTYPHSHSQHHYPSATASASSVVATAAPSQSRRARNTTTLSAVSSRTASANSSSPPSSVKQPPTTATPTTTTTTTREARHSGEIQVTSSSSSSSQVQPAQRVSHSRTRARPSAAATAALTNTTTTTAAGGGGGGRHSEGGAAPRVLCHFGKPRPAVDSDDEDDRSDDAEVDTDGRDKRRAPNPAVDDDDDDDDEDEDDGDLDEDRPAMLNRRSAAAAATTTAAPAARRHRRSGNGTSERTSGRHGSHVRPIPRLRLSKRTNSQRMVPMKVVLDNAGKSFSLQSSVGNSLYAHPASERLNASHHSDGSIVSTIFSVDGNGNARLLDLSGRPSTDALLSVGGAAVESHGPVLENGEMWNLLELSSRGDAAVPSALAANERGTDATASGGIGSGGGASTGALADAHAVSTSLVSASSTTNNNNNNNNNNSGAGAGAYATPVAVNIAGAGSPSPPSGLLQRHSFRDIMSPTARFRAKRASVHGTNSVRPSTDAMMTTSTAAATAAAAAKMTPPAADITGQSRNDDGRRTPSSRQATPPPQVALTRDMSTTAPTAPSPLLSAFEHLPSAGEVRDKMLSAEHVASPGVSVMASDPASAVTVPLPLSRQTSSGSHTSSTPQTATTTTATTTTTTTTTTAAAVTATAVATSAGGIALHPQKPLPLAELTSSRREVTQPRLSRPSSTSHSHSSSSSSGGGGNANANGNGNANAGRAGSAGVGGVSKSVSTSASTRVSSGLSSAVSSARVVPSVEAVYGGTRTTATAATPSPHTMYSFPPVHTVSTGSSASASPARQPRATPKSVAAEGTTVVPSLTMPASCSPTLPPSQPKAATRLSISTSLGSVPASITVSMPAFSAGGGGPPAVEAAAATTYSAMSLRPRTRGSVPGSAPSAGRTLSAAESGERSPPRSASSGRESGAGGAGGAGGARVGGSAVGGAEAMRLYRRPSRKLGSASTSPRLPPHTSGAGAALPSLAADAAPTSPPHTDKATTRSPEHAPLIALMEVSCAQSPASREVSPQRQGNSRRASGSPPRTGGAPAAATGPGLSTHTQGSDAREDVLATPAEIVARATAARATAPLRPPLAGSAGPSATATRALKIPSCRALSPASATLGVSEREDGNAHSLPSSVGLRPAATPLTSCLVTSVPAGSGGSSSLAAGTSGLMNSASFSRARAPPLTSMMMANDPDGQPLEGCDVSVTGASQHRVSITAPSPTEIDRDRRKRQEEALSQALMNKMMHPNR